MEVIKSTIEKIINLPAKPATPYPHMVSWLFSVFVLFSFIYICEVTGL